MLYWWYVRLPFLIRKKKTHIVFSGVMITRRMLSNVKLSEGLKVYVPCLCFCPVYLKLAWLRSDSQIIAKSGSPCVKSCVPAVKTRHVFSTVPRFIRLLKMFLPIFKIVWSFINLRQCDADYMELTNQRLETRFAQHLPGNIKTVY